MKTGSGKWYARVAVVTAIVVTVALVIYNYLPSWITKIKSSTMAARATSNADADA